VRVCVGGGGHCWEAVKQWQGQAGHAFRLEDLGHVNQHLRVLQPAEGQNLQPS